MTKLRVSRFLAVFLALLMVCSVVSLPAFAEEEDGAELLTATGMEEDASSEDASKGDKKSSVSLQSISEELNVISYGKYLEQFKDKPAGKSAFSVDVFSYLDGEEKLVGNVRTETLDGEKVLWTPDGSTVTWKATAPSDGLYTMRITYVTTNGEEDKGKATSIERKFTIDDEIPFAEARYLTLSKVWKDDYATDENGERIFETDNTGSDIRPNKDMIREKRSVDLYDANGVYTSPLSYYITAGEHEFAFEAIREDLCLVNIEFLPTQAIPTYAEYFEKLQSKGYTEVSADATFKIQAEYMDETSDQMIYPVYDRTSSITEPQHPSQIRLNTTGGEKWVNPGQWIRYVVTPTESGLYTLVLRFKQSILAGMFTSRRLYINGEVPFQEAGALRFNYSDDWQIAPLGNDDGAYQFYFEAGKEYTIELEVCLGDLGDVVNTVSDSLTSLNKDYLRILQLTGAVPDQYRDYGFTRVLPGTVKDLVVQKGVLQNVLDFINTTEGMKGSQVSTIEEIVRVLTTMTKSESSIAGSLNDLKSYIGNLGTWLMDARSQPLELDYIVFQGESQKLPSNRETFWQSTIFEVRSFIASFFNDYTSMGASDDTTEESVIVWISSDRDRARIIRTLIDNDFTPKTHRTVDLKLVAGGALLPSVLAGSGPDITPAMGSGEVINYAIRSALVPITTINEDAPTYNRFTDVDEVLKRFDPSAVTPLSFEGDAYNDETGQYDKHIKELYAIPEQQTFNMLYYRKDILADLNLELPETWDDMLAMIPVLQYNNMEVGIPGDYTMYLYQQGGDYWADNGMRINLDANLNLECFKKMCDMFTQYSLPAEYNFANRFRTGEVPIGVADYCGTYNTLTVFATEIRGLWGFTKMPGTIRADGTVDHTIGSGVSGIVILRGAKHLDGAWDFIKWYTDSFFQAQYANELTAIVGPASKIPTANKEAIKEMSWSSSELEAIEEQMNWLTTIPEYPGGYIIGRYTSFAFAAAYNEGEDPVEALLEYIPLINKEITRKRKEFHLDTLEVGDTLEKRNARKAQSQQDANEPDGQD